MKAKEAEQLTGLSKQTLIWYEKEGLIHPERNENRYREYSDQDVKTLQLIKLLRNMDISIDDIRQILNGHLSMEEIFEQQKAYLHQEESKIKDLEKKVRFYADTKAPLINDLEKLHKPKIGLGGQEKALEPFHIGTHPDRKRLEKLLFWNGVWFVSVIAVVSLFLCQFEHVWGIVPPLFVPLTLGAALIFVLFGSGIPQLGLRNIADRYFQYVEYSREGIAYISPKTLQEKIRFLQKTFHRQDTLTYVSYDQVEKVSVIHDTKYIRIFLPIASELFVTSFVFHLKDKTSFSILHQMFYGNDEEVILRILREHVGQVVITKRPCA